MEPSLGSQEALQVFPRIQFLQNQAQWQLLLLVFLVLSNAYQTSHVRSINAPHTETPCNILQTPQAVEVANRVIYQTQIEEFFFFVLGSF